MSLVSLFHRHSSRRARVANSAQAEALELRLLLSASPLGSESLVNTTTAGRQTVARDGQTSVDSAADGSTVVVWTGQVSDGWFADTDVFARRFDADGMPLGDEFRVNTVTDGKQREASVAVAEDGSTLIVWQSKDQDGSSWGIYGQRYLPDGTADGAQFRINETTRGPQMQPAAVWLTDGGFVVSWSGRGMGDHHGIFARRYDADGAAVTGEFRVNDHTWCHQHTPSVAALPDGGYAIAWSGFGHRDWNGVYVRGFDAEDVALSDSALVNRRRFWPQSRPAIAVAEDGTAVVVWQSLFQDSFGFSIYGRRLDTSLQPTGNEFRVTQIHRGWQSAPHVEYLAGGNFVVAWQGHGGGDKQGIHFREFEPDGIPVGNQERVNQTSKGWQVRPSIAATPGGFSIVWSGKGMGDRHGVFVRPFGDDGNDSDNGDGNGDGEPGENAAPILDPIPAETGVVGIEVAFTAVADDPDDAPEPLMFRLDDGSPDGATIDPVTGVFRWTPASDQTGEFQFDVVVSDGADEDSQPVTVNVSPAVNNPPMIEPIADQAIDEGQLIEVPVMAMDPDPNPMLTFSLLTALPGDAAVDPVTGLFSWTPGEEDGPDTFSVTVQVSDGDLTDTETFQLTVEEVNEPPVLDPIADQQIMQEAQLTFTAVASDPDLPANSLTFSLGPGSPIGASIDPVSGLFSWMPGLGVTPGDVFVMVLVSDGNESDEQTVRISVLAAET